MTDSPSLFVKMRQKQRIEEVTRNQDKNHKGQLSENFKNQPDGDRIIESNKENAFEVAHNQ